MPRYLEEILLLKNLLTKLFTSQSIKSWKIPWSLMWFLNAFVRVSCALINRFVLKLLQMPQTQLSHYRVSVCSTAQAVPGLPKRHLREQRPCPTHTWQGTTTQQQAANEVHQLISNPSTMCAAGTQVVSKASANYATVTGREIPRLKFVVIFVHLLFASSPASLVSMPLWMQDKVLSPFRAQYSEFKRVTDMMKLAKTRLLIWESLSMAGVPKQTAKGSHKSVPCHLILTLCTLVTSDG